MPSLKVKGTSNKSASKYLLYQDNFLLVKYILYNINNNNNDNNNNDDDDDNNDVKMKNMMMVMTL